jgi:hypothetical protein
MEMANGGAQSAADEDTRLGWTTGFEPVIFRATT